MSLCPHCNSEKIIKNGKLKNKQRYLCKECKRSFSSSKDFIKEDEVLSAMTFTNYKRDSDWIDEKTQSKRYVITSAQSDTDIDEKFLNCLLTYCDHNDAQLLIIPIRYKNPTSQQQNKIEYSYPEIIKDYLFENNIRLHSKLKVLGSLKIAATAEHPLTGLASITKGDTIIVGHNQLQSTTLPVQLEDFPVIMATTGTVSVKNYSASKQGYKAEFNHSNSAAVIELDEDIFHLRHLNFDGEGFYDLDNYYAEDNVTANDTIHALVTGDEHAIFNCVNVKNATFAEGGICDVLHPTYIVRHDLLDCHSISHHHKNDFLTRFKKSVNNQHKIEDELILTFNHVVDTTLDGSINVIVSSNHNDHLKRWLNECIIDKEPWNAILYHKLMFNMLSSIEDNPSEIPNPFELWSADSFKEADVDVIFIKRTESFKMFDIEIAIHGDKGTNGSRGSREALSKLPSKCIIGHSHSPGIEKGVYQVGTSSELKLDYNDGPSSWMNTHAIIYPNGKRQLINIIRGKWRK